MKVSFYILLVFLFPLILQNQDKETNDEIFIKNAAQKTAEEGKSLAIEFWSPSCNPCMALKRDIFENKIQSAFVHKYFSVVQLSPADSTYDSLCKYFNLKAQSTVVYVDKNGNEIDRTVGYNGDKDAYLNIMKEISSGKNLYKDVLKKYYEDTLNAVNCSRMARKSASRYELQKAMNLYKNILDYDQSDTFNLRAECMFKIAEMDLMYSGSLEKLREYVTRDTKNPFAPKAYVYLINDLINKKDKSGCLAICEDGFNKYPDSWEILNKYAWALCSFTVEEEYPKALTMVQKSISLNPSRPGTYSTEAWIHYKMGNREKAIELQKKAIEIFPDRSFTQDLETFEKK
jgi:thioredoxin-related protein